MPKNLKELAKKLFYLKEQKLTYLHLMPLRADAPPPQRWRLCGGGFRYRMTRALGTNKDLENLTRELRKAASACVWILS
ncbi:MAG: hypothetical protein ACLVJH_18315 [Faecalibacterium prausnitzii]